MSSDAVLIHGTIQAGLLLYAAAVTLRFFASPADWQQFSPRLRLARWLWTAACLVYLAHVAAAFHFAHGWSHAAAVEHTRQIGGFGAGIYVNHLFTLLWSADVLAWWCCAHWYAGRTGWIDVTLHGSMLFVIFNATVVFASGVSRWAGVALFVWLGVLWARRVRTYS